MKKGKRDQRQYDLVQQRSAGPHTEHDTEDSGSGRIPSQARTGRHDRLPVKGHGRVCILMEAEARTYEDGGPPQDEPGPRKIGLPKIPSIIAYGMIPEPNERIIGDVNGDRFGGRGQHRLLQQHSSGAFSMATTRSQAQARLGQAAQHRRCLHQNRPRLPGHRRVHLRHHRIPMLGRIEEGADFRGRPTWQGSTRTFCKGMTPRIRQIQHRARTGAARPGVI